jgi:HPt (histidine-containing phosphotransfer) domain-containing protein
MNMRTLDPVIFAEFLDTLGHESAVIWIDKFLQTLDLVSLDRAVVEADRSNVFETAHLITARAGLLGCRCLVEACVELQRACKTGVDFLTPYATMCAAAAEASLALRNAL